MILINVGGIDSAIKRFGKLKVAKAIGDGIRESAFLVERYSKIAITTGATRAIRTGFLRNSIGVQSYSTYQATIYPTAPYAIFVHEGTRFMRERPFMTVGAKQALPYIRAAFNHHIKSL
jgi:hypothetical protein